MAIQKITIKEFLDLSKQHPVFDVRSPAEFLHAHFPFAHSLPLFNNDERKAVGTIYKQQSRQQAIKAGLDFFGGRMRDIVEQAEQIVSKNNSALIVHCWRGGMRSAAIGWLLDLYGYKVYTLTGGYKAFRNWVLKQFELPYKLKILGGYTGSGKSLLIEELQRLDKPVIHLEALAHHKGSAFGALDEDQPTQEMFENFLAINLFYQQEKISNPEKQPGLHNDESTSSIWVEDESQRIGNLHIPKAFWETMRNSSIYFIDIPFDKRLEYLTETYGTIEKEKLTDAIMRIQKRLGGLETKNAINFLSENNIPGCFSILLNYYDKCYSKGLHNRSNIDDLLNNITCSSVTVENIKRLAILQNKV